MPKPVEYRYHVPGFGTWKIAYDVAGRKWLLGYTTSPGRAIWHPVRHFDVLEAAAIAVAERNTGETIWDRFGYGKGQNFDLSRWTTDKAEGVQTDAQD